MYRVGLGFDLHPLVTGRPLWLGGVKIPFELGLKGHSDADVLLHSLADALLGAAGLKDIGHRFPSDDQRYKNVSSILLLREVHDLLISRRYKVVNVDAVIIAQRPRVSPYIEEMVNNISAVLNINPDMVSVKSTTTEGLGVCGRGEAIAAQAVVLITRD
ncbi:MAG TPA: 2-C-methyl-D-erythritol 2,4-cyclodiphosphate synthase [Firmicutes bacterium]|nr:2-C-methyl-D-erythritol 2,4-cyclodiphosphate synthase [Bacillota bacterium]